MTTTDTSRLILAHPDLGTVGGAGLHAAITAIYKKIGDNLATRILVNLSVANAATATFEHDFRVAFGDLRYDLYIAASTDPYDLTRITATSTPPLSQFAVVATPSFLTTKINVTNNSGSTRNLVLVVLMDPLKLFEGDVQDVDVTTTAPEDGQALVYDSASTKFKPGASGDSSFKLQSVSTPTLVLKGGSIIDGDDEYQTYNGGGATTAANYKVDLSLNLTTILGSAPVNATTYYLFIDKFTLGTEQTLDTGNQVYGVVQANFSLSTTRHRDSNRYVYIGFIKSATSGTVWSGAGSSFGTEAFRRHDRMSRFFSFPEVMPTTAITSATATNTINHNLSGKPQVVLATYFDGTNEYPLEPQSFVKNVTSTQLIVSSLGLTFGGGQELRVYAVRFPSQTQIAAPSTQKTFGWYTSNATTTVAHGMDIEDIRGCIVEEYNTTTGKYRFLPADQLLKEFDITNLTLEWTGLSPSATLQYRLHVGGTPVPYAIPTIFGGYTKFVGAGPGSYATLTLALAASAAGDSILIARDTTEAADLSIPAGVRIDQMPNTSVTLAGALTNGVRFTGAKGSWKNMNVKLAPTGTQARGVSVEAADCWVDGWVETTTAQTYTDLVHVTSGGARAKVSVGVLRTLGTITNLETNNDGASSTAIWGG